MIVPTKDFYKKLDEEIEYNQTLRRKTVIARKPVVQMLRDCLGEIDEVVDEVFEKKKCLRFDMRKWLMEKPFIDKDLALDIAKKYNKQKQELEQALSGTDTDLNTAYSFLNTSEKRRVIEFYSNLLTEIDDYLQFKTKVKKQRRKQHKPVSLQKQVRFVRYKEQIPELGLVSMEPTKIVKAQRLWLYNERYRVLSFYQALTNSGFTINRMSLQNWDEKRSWSKTVKPNILKEIASATPGKIEKICEAITSTTKQPNGRFHENTLILRIL